MTQRVKMILTNGFDPDVRVYKEALYLVLRGFDVEILCWDRRQENAESESIDGIRVKRFSPRATYGTGYRQIPAYLRFIRQCRDYLKGQDYDYLHCHDLDGMVAGWLVGSRNVRLIFDMHEFYEVLGRRAQKMRYAVRAFVRFYQSKSAYIIYVNDAQVVAIAKKNHHKLIYLPNYPEHSSYLDCEKCTAESLRICYIGNVRQYTELKNLFEACKDLEGVRISVHGSGVAYEHLAKIQPDYPNVEVTGRYHFSESSRLYGQTDLLYIIYPTTSEQNIIGYPIKFFEAIITKTPMIVGEGTALAEFVRAHGIGFVVDGGDRDDIRALIASLRATPSLLEDKKANLEKIQFDYSWEHVVVNLDKIYEVEI